MLQVKAEKSSVCRFFPAATAWGSDRTQHRVLASVALCRNFLNQAWLQICPVWNEKVINTQQKFRKVLGNEANELCQRRCTKQAAKPGAQQEAEMVTPQSYCGVCSPPTQLEQGSHVYPKMLLNVGQVHVQSHTKGRSAACHKILVATLRRLSPNAGEVVC